MALLTQAAYARHREVSPAMVSKYIRHGKIPKNCLQTQKGKRLIDRDAADQALLENLDRIRNPKFNMPEPMPKTWFYTGQNRDTAARLNIQEQAADIASENEEPGPGGYMIPAPLWDILYIGALFTLDPDRVEIERITKTEWRLSIDDLDNESGERCGWAVELSFDFQGYGGQV